MVALRRAVLAAGFFVAVGAQGAWAQTSLSLPAVLAGVNAEVYSGGGGALLDEHTYQGSSIPVTVNAGSGGSTAMGSVTSASGQPLVSFTATAAAGMTARAGAELLYHFALVGPADYTAPINVSLTGQYMFTGGAQDINQGVELLVQCYPNACGTGMNLAKLFDNVGSNGVKDYTLNFQIRAQQDYIIDMGGIITANNVFGMTDKTVSGWIDPVINFSFNDPGTDPSLFHLAYSNGLFPAAATGGVPEPATWAMMLTGFMSAGALLRRRKWVVLPS